MQIYTYISEHCLEDAREHGFSKSVKSLSEKIELDQTSSGLIRYPPPFLVKKFGKQGRLVVEEKFDGEDCLLIFLRLLIRSHSDYHEYFINSPKEFHKEVLQCRWFGLLVLQEQCFQSPGQRLSFHNKSHLGSSMGL